MTKQWALVIFMGYFPTTHFIDKNGQVFKPKISTLNVDAVLRTLREMGPR